VLPQLLADRQIRDVSVEDVPLEEIVASLFRGAAAQPEPVAEPAGVS
jgi:hypothetical protein